MLLSICSEEAEDELIRYVFSTKIYLATMLREDWSFYTFIILHKIFVLSRKKMKDQKLGADSITKASMSCDTILIKTESHIACPPSSG